MVVMKKIKRVYVVIALLMIFLVSVSGCDLGKKKEFKVKEHLNDVVLTINNTEYTLEDIGYYIANGEAAVEAQALIYSPNNPEQYWNKHTNGVFIKVQAKQNVIDNFTRDILLALAAEENGISLSDEEKEQCRAAAQTALGQLNSYQKSEAGVSIDSLNEAMENAYLGQKYIDYRLENDGSDDYTAQDWQVGGLCYKGFMSEYKIKVNDEIWEKVDFGEVTIER